MLNIPDYGFPTNSMNQLSVDTDGWLSQGRLASARAEIKSWEIPPSATTCVITPHSARLCQGKVVPGAEESPQGDKRSNQRCTSRTKKLGEEYCTQSNQTKPNPPQPERQNQVKNKLHCTQSSSIIILLLYCQVTICYSSENMQLRFLILCL